MAKQSVHFFDKETTKELIKQACYLTKEIHIFKFLICSMTAGAFITFGALFSVLLASGINIPGYVRLLEGFGFSTGFFDV
ncbi:MAG: hypothetical protein K940chlam8_00983 [Chlamydiae bacterium]|nr:hypothetical protein [Chlamydiota bacterium]